MPMLLEEFILALTHRRLVLDALIGAAWFGECSDPFHVHNECESVKGYTRANKSSLWYRRPVRVC